MSEEGGALSRPSRVLFVNSGILGQGTFARFVRQTLVEGEGGAARDIAATQIIVSEGLSVGERVMRRLLCMRLWSDGVAGLRNLDVHRFRAELNAGLIASLRIRRLLASGCHFDVLHFHRQATAYVSLAHMRRTPTIVSIDCTQRCVLQQANSAAEAHSYAPNVRRDGQIFRAAKLIVTTSRWAADCVREDYPDCRTEIVVMPNPVQLQAFDAGWTEDRYARALREPGRRPRVLFMGGDFGRKGGFDLLDAWREGRFGERAELDLVTSWRLDPGRLPPGVRVHADIAAHTPAWRERWRDADLFVLPTRDDASPIVYQEAAAAGLPAVGTRLNSVPEMIDDERTGLLVPPGDREALARALGRLLASAPHRREMGLAARRRVESTAHPEAYGERLGEAIHRLARAGRG